MMALSTGWSYDELSRCADERHPMSRPVGENLFYNLKAVSNVVGDGYSMQRPQVIRDSRYREYFPRAGTSFLIAFSVVSSKMCLISVLAPRTISAVFPAMCRKSFRSPSGTGAPGLM